MQQLLGSGAQQSYLWECKSIGDYKEGLQVGKSKGSKGLRYLQAIEEEDQQTILLEEQGKDLAAEEALYEAQEEAVEGVERKAKCRFYIPVISFFKLNSPIAAFLTSK